MSDLDSKKPTMLNLNSVLLVLSILVIMVSSIRYLSPLGSLPDDMRGVRMDMNEVQRTQAVQTEAIKTLADVARDGRDLRRDFDRSYAEQSAAIKRHDAEIRSVKEMLDRIERSQLRH